MPGVFLSPGGRYRPDIDGLRAVAVSAVLGFHYFPRYFPGGFAGVDIFFVISGFLIAGIILDDLAENKFSFPAFYARRIRRLFPALALVLAATLAAGWLVLFPGEFKALGKHTAGGAGFISNILYWLESGYFDAEAASKPLLHLWSLGLEEQFYLAFPFLIWWAGKKGFREISLIILVLAASLAYNFQIRHTNQAADFYSPLARFWELLAGAVLACLSRVPSASPLRRAALLDTLAWLFYKKPGPNFGATLGHTLSALGFIMVLLAVFTFSERLSWPGYWAVAPVAGASLILAAGPAGWFNRRLLSNRLVVAVGLISYPLYLWHWPILAYMRILNGGMPARQERILGALISLALAGLTYKLLERPIRFGARFRALKTFVLAALLAVAAGAGIFIYARDGLPERGITPPEYEVTAQRDEDCYAYTGINYNEINKMGFRCRFSGGHGPVTVALIGNSHAHSTYFGVEKYNSSIGLNTLLLGGRGRIPLLLGTEYLIENDDELKKSYRELLFHYFEFLLNRPDIKFVFILNHVDTTMRARAYLQPTIDRLTKAGKKVFTVVDWPVLPRSGLDYVIRPYSEFFSFQAANDRRRELNRDSLLNSRTSWPEYFQLLRSLKNATLIDGTWDAFCPGPECLVFSETGRLLYYDNNHLTNAGSEFLTEKVLAPYLAESAGVN